MTSKKEFENAQSLLRKRRDLWKQSPEVWDSFHYLRSIFDTTEPWSFLNEIIQNSIDVGAKQVQIRVYDDAVEIQHNGTEPLNSGAVQGLCGFSLSTKGLDSVGFMGIGFKSFTGFFENVSISDDGISFLLNAPHPKGKSIEIEELYSPVWINKTPNREIGMTTIFRFGKPKKGTITKFLEITQSINLTNLAVIGSGSKSLDVLRVDNYEYRMKEHADNRIVSVTTSKDGEEIDKSHFFILESEVTLDKEATAEMKAIRKVRNASTNSIETVTRKIRLLKELEVEISEEGNIDLQKVKPKKMDSGQMFCLVSLGQEFPFNIAIDTDWLMNAERTRLRDKNEAGLWHRQLLSSVPELIRKYLEWVNELNLTTKERAISLDVFPDRDWEVTTGLEFIDEGEFKEILREELSDCEFLLCSDKNLSSPSVVRDIPKKPSSMKDKAYKNLIRNCFTCPIIDRRAIEIGSIAYLKNLGTFLPYPETDEVDVGTIQSLWDEKESNNYKHILDIITKIITNDANEYGNTSFPTCGPMVVPCKDKTWTNILGPQIVFTQLPKRKGVEKILYETLIESNPDIKDTSEVEKNLRQISTSYRYRWQISPGTYWKMIAKNSSPEIISKIKELKIPLDDENITAMFCYSYRINKPELITHLNTHNKPMKKNICVIGPPFANNKIKQIFPEKMFVYKGPEKIIKSDEVKVQKFLEKTGAISLKPTLKSNKNMDAKKAEEFIGSPPPSGKQIGQTYDGHNWIWGVKLDDSKDMNALSEYLSDPDDELKKAITQAGKFLQLKHDYGSKKGIKTNSPIDCEWIIQLRNVAWVLCADDKLRKPKDTSIATKGEMPKGKQAKIAEEIAKLYTEVGIRFGNDLPDDPQNALQYWKTEPASREPKLFIKNIKELRDEKILSHDDLLKLVREVLWVTSKSSAPLRRFIDADNFDDWDGFLGKWDTIDLRIRKTLGKIGFKPKTSLDSSIAKEIVKKISERDGGINERNLDLLRQANSIILDKSPEDFPNSHFLRYDDSWSSDNKNAYIQLIGDPHRFSDLDSRIIRPEQLPKKLDTLKNIILKSNYPLLIDNQIEIIGQKLTSSDTENNIQRLISSLNLPFEIDVECYGEYPFSVTLDGKEMNTHYLIQYGSNLNEDKAIIHLSGDSNRWQNKISDFLTNQIQYHNSLKDTISECLGAAQNDDDFDDASNMLKNEGIELVERINSNIYSTSTKDGKDTTGKKPILPKQRGVLNDPLGQLDKVTKEELTRSRKSPKNSNKSKDPKKSNKKGITIKGKTTKDIAAERKKTGDAAEKIVLDELKKEGWEVLSWNDEFKEERIGHDLVFKKEKDVRVVEVKGHKGKWSGDQDISEAQLRMGLTFHGETPEKYPDCKYSVWLYVVENVYGEYNIETIDWPNKEIAAYFPKTVWTDK